MMRAVHDSKKAYWYLIQGGSDSDPRRSRCIVARISPSWWQPSQLILLDINDLQISCSSKRIRNWSCRCSLVETLFLTILHTISDTCMMSHMHYVQLCIKTKGHIWVSASDAQGWHNFMVLCVATNILNHLCSLCNTCLPNGAATKSVTPQGKSASLIANC